MFLELNKRKYKNLLIKQLFNIEEKIVTHDLEKPSNN